MTNIQIIKAALEGFADLAAIEAEMLAAEEFVASNFDSDGIIANCIVTLDMSADSDTLVDVTVTDDESVEASEVETIGVPVDSCEEIISLASVPYVRIYCENALIAAAE